MYAIRSYYGPIILLLSRYELKYFIASKIDYPIEAQENEIQGQVIVGIRITSYNVCYTKLLRIYFFYFKWIINTDICTQ